MCVLGGGVINLIFLTHSFTARELAVWTFGPRRFVRRFRGGAGSSPCVEVREEEEARGATVGRGQTAERH